MGQLERILSLRLLNYRNRPFYAFNLNGEDITMLFDSGASTPVWCMGENKLKRSYPDVVEKNEVCYISGFGKEAVEGKVYVIPVFELRDDMGAYRIKNLQLAVCKNPEIGCDFIISDTMLSKADTLIQRRGEKMLKIYFDKDEYYCTPRYDNSGKKFSVTVWAQNEDK